MTSPERTILGIDLGVTALAMASLEDDGRTRVVPNAEGHDTTLACVHIYEEDGVAVGSEARKMMALDPANVLEDVPWHLGEPDWHPLLHGRKWSAQELVALCLRKLREDASDLRGFEARRAVLAVPAWWDSARRAASPESTSARANLTRNRQRLTLRADSYGSERTTFDISQVLIPKKLALRLATLRENKEFFIRPGYEENRRAFVAGTYQPFKNTTVHVSFEKGHMDNNLTIGWNGTIVPDRTDLENRLAQVAALPDQPEVHLRPNKLVSYKVVAMVMASAQRLGVTKIGLVGNEQFMN